MPRRISQANRDELGFGPGGISSSGVKLDFRRRPGANDAQVIEYLTKKGYLRTKQVLTQESNHIDHKDGKPDFSDRTAYGNQRYIRAFELLSGWIDSNLDIYKVSEPSCALGQHINKLSSS